MFADTFCTCSLNKDVVGKRVAMIAELVNEHGHSKSCKKRSPNCRWHYPKFPLAETVFIDANREIPETEKLTTIERETILKRVKNVLIDIVDGKEKRSKKVDDIIEKYPKSEKENTIYKQILMILDEANKEEEEENRLQSI